MSTPTKNEIKLKPCCVMLEPITPKANGEFSAELKKVINERNLLTTKTRKRVTEALEEIENENHVSYKKTKKAKIFNEIIESEENYIRQLEVIIEFFIKPVQERELLSSKDFDILFRDLTSIYRINKELLEELRKTPNNVAKAFSKIAPFFKSYSFYASGFKKSLEILQNTSRNNPKFGKFLENQESRPEVQSKLSALLIAPIQRVPRYKLLLSSLFNLTFPDEEDYEILLDSLQKVEDAADHINRIIKDQENMQRLIEVQRCLVNGEPNVITPGRNLIKEGPLKLLTNSGHSQTIHVVLMSDIIMFCKMKKQELKVNSLKCTGIYPLNKCKVTLLNSKGAVKVVCQEEEILFYHESYFETVKWLESIQSAIETLLSDRNTLKKESTIRRPVKRKDVSEYNEVGLSPGKKMKKKARFEDDNNISKRLTLSKRRPLRATSNCLNYSTSTGATPSFLITLKPPEERLSMESHNTDSNCSVSRELFVFGQTHVDHGFSFKMNQWLCGIGSSVKKFFGFKK